VQLLQQRGGELAQHPCDADLSSRRELKILRLVDVPQAEI